MKMKRIMALVMTSAMVMGTLAGCGASTDTTDTTQSQSENNSTAAAATTETASEEKEWYGTEDGKTVTLQFWGGIQPEYGYDEIVENFNIRIDDIEQKRYERFVELNILGYFFEDKCLIRPFVAYQSYYIFYLLGKIP